MRRRNGKGWGIPKGIIERGHTQKETALKEVWEEAGLKGRLVGRPLGSYEFDKWGDAFNVVIFLMDVREECDEWPESGWRERKWVSFRKAAALLDGHPAQPLLERARAALAKR